MPEWYIKLYILFNFFTFLFMLIYDWKVCINWLFSVNISVLISIYIHHYHYYLSLLAILIGGKWIILQLVCQIDRKKSQCKISVIKILFISMSDFYTAIHDSLFTIYYSLRDAR